jgi:hypothetical protein
MVIRLSSDPYYENTVVLDDSTYRFTYRWIELESAWYLDIDGMSTPSFVLHGIKLVGGLDLVEPYGMLDFGALWCVDLSGQNRDPGFENISTDFVLYYV